MSSLFAAAVGRCEVCRLCLQLLHQELALSLSRQAAGTHCVISGLQSMQKY